MAQLAVAAANTAPTDPYAARERHHNEGHGRRLTAAFEALEAFPVLVESRNRVLRLFEAGEPSTADVVAAVEADVALAVTVLRLANQVDGRTPGPGRERGQGRRGALARAPCRRSPAAPARLTSSSAPPSGRAFPSASACTPWPPSAPPTGWRARSATRPATA